MKASAEEVRKALHAVIWDDRDDETVDTVAGLFESLDKHIAHLEEQLEAVRKGRNKLMASYQALFIQSQKLEKIVVEQAIAIYDLSAENGEMPTPPADRLH